MQRFFSKTRDIENEDDREGYPSKKWFFGTFELNEQRVGHGRRRLQCLPRQRLGQHGGGLARPDARERQRLQHVA